MTSFLEQFQQGWAHTVGDAPEPGMDLSDREVLEALAAGGVKRRTTEPQSVTDRMRPCRLIHEVQFPPPEGLDEEVIDRLSPLQGSSEVFGIRT